MEKIREPASFRDPKGYVFYSKGEVYRHISKSGVNDFCCLEASDLKKYLLDQKMLVPFERTNDCNESEIIVKTKKLLFVSYPYEWSFSQYKDAALLTLKIMKKALQYDIWLKDASAYNVQFDNGLPIFIDLLSFAPYPKNQPWIAYGQFCRHFLAPLLLMAKTDLRMGCLMKEFIDGVPLDLASKLLPYKTKFSPFIYIHIHLHAKIQKKYEDKGKVAQASAQGLSKKNLLNLIESLHSLIESLRLKETKTEWGDYYNSTNYTNTAFDQKRKIIEDFIKPISFNIACDLGANNGEFSRIDSLKNAHVISFDIDHLAIEKNYLFNKKEKISNILPLLLDLTNPAPAIGWANQERKSVFERCKVDVALALALIHHLAISNNVPLEKCAKLFAQITQNLVIEFVPKEDSQVKILLSSREDIFPDYHIDGFEKAFLQYFEIVDKKNIQDSLRSVYLMKTKVVS